MADEKSVDSCWQYNKETRERHEKLEKRHDDLATRVFEKLDGLERSLVARLPVWATILISLLTMAVGILWGEK